MNGPGDFNDDPDLSNPDVDVLIDLQSGSVSIVIKGAGTEDGSLELESVKPDDDLAPKE